MTPIAQFTPTLMQKLLGRQYKWWYIVLFYRNSQLTYNANSLFHSLSSIVSFLLLILTWYIGSNGNTNLDFRQILTYLVIGYMYSALTPMWISEMLGYKIQSGSLTSYLLKPVSIFWLGFAEMIGRGVVVASILILIPYLILLPFLAPYMNISTNILSYVNLSLLLILTFTIKYSIDFIIGCTSFWATNNGGIIHFYGTIMRFLDGSAIPLYLIRQFVPLILFLPTSYIIYYPLELYNSPQNSNNYVVFASGIAWCIALYFLAKFIFRLGLKRNEAVGL
jgi:ABC-2 type transport system permease protein